MKEGMCLSSTITSLISSHKLSIKDCCMQIFVQYSCLIESQIVLTDNTSPPIFTPDNNRKTKELKICLVYGQQGEGMYLAF